LQALRTRAKTERQIFKTGTGILEVLDLDSYSLVLFIYVYGMK
jgi:hypothetical protein